MPQLTVNDESVRLLKWRVHHGAQVKSGDVICDVETTKAVSEILADADGILFHLAQPDTSLKIGDRLAVAGPSLQAIHIFLEGESLAPPAARDTTGPRATAKAAALAAVLGVTIDDVAKAGVVGTVKESDVRLFADLRTQQPHSARGDAASISGAHRERPLSSHELSVIRNLRQTLSQTVLATVENDLDVESLELACEALRADGLMASLQNVLMWAIGRTLPKFERLLTFQYAGGVYRYDGIHVGFVVKTPDHRLYVPVVHDVDKLSLTSVVREMVTTGMRAYRGRPTPRDLEGACLAVSHVSEANRFVALPSAFQSSILALGGPRAVVRLKVGAPIEVRVATVTLTYDHSVCDGAYAAAFLNACCEEAEAVRVDR